MLTDPFLSIIIPVYNEEKRLPKAIEQIDAFLHTQPFTAEVLVVENGSQDRTIEIAQTYAKKIPYLKVLCIEQNGKGRAVRAGMLAAKGEYRIFADVDLSMPISEVVRFIPPVLPVMDIAIASREANGAVRYNEPFHRHLTGRVFNTLVRWTALPGLQDTQCGFKCFKGRVADDVFRLQTLMGWSFDTEILYIARQRGYQIIEVPIPWYYNPDSRVRLFKDSISMAIDLLTMRSNARRGAYDSPIENRETN